MAKITQWNKAQKLALRGNVDAAYDALAPLATEGDVGVNVTLVEIAAYRGNWQEVMKRVEVLFGTPDEIFTQNVYDDMAALLARSGEELKQWEEVERIARFAKTKLSREKNDDARFETIRLLTTYAGRCGKGSLLPEAEPEESRKRRYETVLMASKNVVFDSDQQRLRRLFASAYTADYEPGAIEIYDREKALPNSFEMVAFLAAALSRVGREQEAWRAIVDGLRYWRPVHVSQVLPVVLLVNDALKPLMTPKRCGEVMRAPRGPMAEGK